jgi:Flp pilus assembly pilin Flp
VGRRRAPSLVARLWAEDGGQDLVEYALLLMFFGVVLLATWTSITTALGTNFGQTNTGVQGLWDAPPPGGS